MLSGRDVRATANDLIAPLDEELSQLGGRAESCRECRQRNSWPERMLLVMLGDDRFRPRPELIEAFVGQSRVADQNRSLRVPATTVGGEPPQVVPSAYPQERGCDIIPPANGSMSRAVAIAWEGDPGAGSITAPPATT